MKSIGITDINLSVKGSDGQHLASQSVLWQEVTIDRRQFNGKDAVCRSTP